MMIEVITILGCATLFSTIICLISIIMFIIYDKFNIGTSIFEKYKFVPEYTMAVAGLMLLVTFIVSLSWFLYLVLTL